MVTSVVWLTGAGSLFDKNLLAAANLENNSTAVLSEKTGNQTMQNSANSDELDKIIFDILNGDYNRQKVAESKLENILVNEEVGLKLLEAAAQIPRNKIHDPFSRRSMLIRIAAKHKSALYYPIIESGFFNYDNDSQSWAIKLLAHDASAGALEVISRIVRQSFSRDTFELDQSASGTLEVMKQIADLPFVEWLSDAMDKNKSVGNTVPGIVLLQVQNGWINDNRQTILRFGLEKRISELVSVIKTIATAKGNSWRAQNPYDESSHQIEILVDLYGSLKLEPSIDVLDKVLTLNDPSLKFWAINAKLAHGLPADAIDLEFIAQYPESRILLFEALRKWKSNLPFPVRFKNQQALAESNLVRWLMYPTELNAVPDEIEFMKVESSGLFSRKDKYYFKFRTYEPHWAAKDGWLLGWAGPYAQGILEAHGADTFSEFEKVK
jgi:hypothetical protein